MLLATMSLVGVLLVCLLAGSQASTLRGVSDLELRATAPEQISAHCYPVESHTVTTEDGYILTLHRIPYGKKSPAGPNKPAVYVQHGLLSSSADYIVIGPEKGLGYLLADAGYDVWLGNCRGNTWSKGHTSLNPSKSKFWKFSWHEMGVYDLPAVIDYILATTSQEKLFYIGHSMGTTMFYVMGAERPEYNDKIRAMISLAPIAFMEHVKTPLLKQIATAGNQIGKLLSLMGVNEFLPHSDLFPIMGSLLCHEQAITKEICSNVLFLMCGFNSKELNVTLLPLIMENAPAGSSTRNLVHYGQSIKSGRFEQFDHGTIKNLVVYGSLRPPKYDLSKITAPVALMYGNNDNLGPPEDVATLYGQLPNVISYYKVPDDQFNHIDFLWAINVKTLLYDEVLSILSKY